jgi:hypothetical protein
MSIFRRGLSIVLLIAGIVACATPSAPEIAATLRVRSADIQAAQVVEGAVTWIRFTVPLTVQNLGATDLRIIDCAAAVDALVSARWNRVWSPICAAASGPILPAGATRDFDLLVSAAIAGPGSPMWSGAPDANYRVSLGVWSAGVDGELPRLFSNRFVLRELP